MVYTLRVYIIIVECRESEMEKKGWEKDLQKKKKKTLDVLYFLRNAADSDYVFGRKPLSITRSLPGLIIVS